MDRSNSDRGGYGRGRGRGVNHSGRGRGGGDAFGRGGRGDDFYGRGRGGGRGEDAFGRGRGGGRGNDVSGRGFGDGRVDDYRGGYRGGRGRSYQQPRPYYQPQGQYGGGRVLDGDGDGSQQPNRSSTDQVRGPVMSDPGVSTWARIAAPPVDSQILTQNQSSIADLHIHEVPKARQPSASSSKGSAENAFTPIRRPDNGGTLASKTLKLLVNHFPVTFNPAKTILHYDIEVRREGSCDNQSVKRSIQKSDLRLIRDKLCSDRPDLFPLLKTAYDGEKSIFSAIRLPVGMYKVQLFDGDNANSRSYEFTIKFVNEVRLSKLRDYLSGNLLQIPRDVLQGMDLVLKENMYHDKISVGKGGRGFYPREPRVGVDLHCGVAAFKGFQQSLKPTFNGLAMCLDYSVLAFCKRMPVIDFLKERILNFQGVNDICRLRKEVTKELRGLKVTVTHRRTRQKYTIAGLTDEITRHISFMLEDPEGKEEPKNIMLLTYFQQKWGKEIQHKDIPCLQLGRNKKSNSVPMEFCILAEGQRVHKEELSTEADKRLRGLSLLPAKVRRDEIQRMVQEEYGPHASKNAVIKNFEFGVGMEMTEVSGRVMRPPDLKSGSLRGNPQRIAVDKNKCQWNLVQGKTVVEGKAAERWALIDFSAGKCYTNDFIGRLMNRCSSLGVSMKDPLVVRFTDMRDLSSVDRLSRLLSNVVEEAGRQSKGKLQIIVCVLAYKDEGYKTLKWVSETKIGVITQCCLSVAVNKSNDQYLANLGLKINAKLGGSNVELIERFRCFADRDHIMFIGADVNHPSPSNKTSPSIAAVVASINWPAATRYAARVSPQCHRQEEIENFGSMCLDLVKTYEQINRQRPNKIVVFRDGVSDGQFHMVLNNELVDLKAAIYDEHYRPSITLVVAQKRHTTRLFPKYENEVVHPGNVPPGTVVDQGIVHPLEFDFYLNSHFGGLGTSKPTHYSVLWDENGFSSDKMQELIYHLCFTFARCTKPVSLVTPVYYADLVAYRGRMFQEVASQNPSQGSTSSSSSTSDSSAPSFDQNLYDLEPHLKDCMFFI